MNYISKGARTQLERQQRIEYVLKRYSMSELRSASILKHAQLENISIDQIEKRIVRPLAELRTKNPTEYEIQALKLQSSDSADDSDKSAVAQIRFIRDSGYADRMRAYKIFINGKLVGQIKRNSVLDIDAPSGLVTIEAKIDWCGSNYITLLAKAGHAFAFEVCNNGSFLGPLAFRSYLKLTRVA